MCTLEDGKELGNGLYSIIVKCKKYISSFYAKRAKPPSVPYPSVSYMYVHMLILKASINIYTFMHIKYDLDLALLILIEQICIVIKEVKGRI